MKAYFNVDVMPGIPKRRLEKIKDAVDLATEILNSKAFKKELIEHDGFDFSKKRSGGPVDGPRIYKHLYDFQGTITIKGVTPHRWSRWTARVKSSRPTTVELNNRKLGRNTGNIAGTLAHELIHCLDHTVADNFGHAGNSPVGKENTAPYWVGDTVKEMLKPAPEPQLAQKKLVCRGWGPFKRCRWVYER